MKNDHLIRDFRGRRSIRFQDRDYSLPGHYFVTICTANRECLFGDIQNGIMRLNDLGRIIEHEWLRTAEIRSNISLGAWVIMPNHIHLIVTIRSSDEPHYITIGAHRNNEGTVMIPVVGATWQVAPTGPHGPKKGSVGAVIGHFKRAATLRIRRLPDQPLFDVWQRNYWESCLNTERQYANVEEYIINNPANWKKDELNPDRVRR